jgi:hypothetical protein
LPCLPFLRRFPILVGLLLLICAPPDVRDERTQSTYLEWLSYPEAEMPAEDPDSSIRLPLPQAATTNNANSQPAGEF